MNRILYVGALSLLILVGGSLAIELVRQDSGYILISVGNTTVEASFWLVALPLVLFLIYGCYRFSVRLLRSFGVGLTVFSKRRSQQFIRKANRGLLRYIEGDWRAAKKDLLSVAKQSEQPLVHLLAAAHAANALGNTAEAQQLLEMAEKSAPENELAVLLSRARLDMSTDNLDASLATLQKAFSLAPSHPVVLALLQKVYAQLNNWDALIELLPRLKASKQYSQEQFSGLEVNAYCALLQGENKLGSPVQREQRLASLWQKLPRHLKTSQTLIAQYCVILLQQDKHDKAELMLRQSLKKNWNTELIKLYGQLTLPQGVDQLAQAERWLSDHPKDADLLMALARIANRCELWGKARSYFETSLSLQESPVAYAELAALVAQLGDHQKSTALYQKGLLLTTQQ